jgi:hypothetical protein
MSSYPTESCRNCAHASWVWSERRYADGKHRIIVQHKARCAALPWRSRAGSRTLEIDAREPLTDCEAWTFHGLSDRAQR